MQQMQDISSSQEISLSQEFPSTQVLPLSQESKLSQESFSDFFFGSLNNNDEINIEDLFRDPEPADPSLVLQDSGDLTLLSITPPPTIPVCLPGTSNWPGNFGFNVSFPPEEIYSKNVDKKVSWIYSAERNKLYVTKDHACPIRFQTSVDCCAVFPSDSLSLKVQATFALPQHTNELVTRCMQHIIEDKNSPGFEQHLIRCQSIGAKYCMDSNTGQYCVEVPFENPSMGEKYSTYIFKFTCFSSCKGGLERRPIMVVFTLQNKDEVIGRHCLPIKICACPFRDSKADDNRNERSHEGSSKKRKSDQMNPSSGGRKNKTNEVYTITTSSVKKYKFLEECSRGYDIKELWDARKHQKKVKKPQMEYVP